jgi:superfamily II DNA or RNA helicase
MTTEVVPALPDHSELKALYDKAIAEINASRNSDLLTASFYRKTSDAVYDTSCAALSDAITDTRMMHTVSAPPGGGKTSFAQAFAVALTRYTENRSEAPYGVVFVVDEIKKADDFYNELTKYLPGKVAVWTTEHDVSCKEWPKLGKEPLAKFERKDLPNWPAPGLDDTRLS